VVPVPSVIRLRRYVRRPHRQRVAFNRKNVFRRDDHTCQYCGVRSHDLTLDHVCRARAAGRPRGRTWSPAAAAATPLKRDRTPHRGAHGAAPAAAAPAFMFSSAYGVLPDVDPAWEAYLPRGH
jgi:hypothetical protein